MATNLVETVKSFFTPEVVDRASTRLGESKEGIEKAVTGGVPMVFAGMLYRSEHGHAPDILSDAHQAVNHHLAQSPENLFTNIAPELASTNSWGRRLFGGGFSGVSDSLASYAGIKSGSANTMLNLLTPLSLNVVGNYAVDNDLTDGGLGSFLASQRSSIMGTLPPGLNMGQFFKDTATYHPGVATIAGHEPQTGSAERPLRHASNTIWWVLLVLVVVGIIAYLIGS